LARHKDRPHFKIINNAALLKIAATLPADLTSLQASNALSKKQVDMYGHAILAAVEKAGNLSASQLPAYPHQRSPRLSPRIPRRINAIRDWRDALAAELNLDPPLLLNKALMSDIAVRRPKDIESLREIESMQDWQVEAFGRQVIDIISRLP